jgi:hypothetical protein
MLVIQISRPIKLCLSFVLNTDRHASDMRGWELGRRSLFVPVVSRLPVAYGTYCTGRRMMIPFFQEISALGKRRCN